MKFSKNVPSLQAMSKIFELPLRLNLFITFSEYLLKCSAKTFDVPETYK